MAVIPSPTMTRQETTREAEENGQERLRMRNGRPDFQKISSMPEMMIRPDERGDIKTFVAECCHGAHTVRSKNKNNRPDSPGGACTRSLNSKVIRTTKSAPLILRGILSPPERRKRTVAKDFQSDLPPFTMEEAESSSYKKREWSATKLPKKSALKKRTASKTEMKLLSLGHHSTEALEVLSPAMSKKKERRWEASQLCKSGRSNDGLVDPESPLKTPTRCFSFDSLSLPPLTTHDTDDGTLATFGSLDLEIHDDTSFKKVEPKSSSLHDATKAVEITETLKETEKLEPVVDSFWTPIYAKQIRSAASMEKVVESYASPTSVGQELHNALAVNVSSVAIEPANDVKEDLRAFSSSIGDHAPWCPEFSDQTVERESSCQYTQGGGTKPCGYGTDLEESAEKHNKKKEHRSRSRSKVRETSKNGSGNSDKIKSKEMKVESDAEPSVEEKKVINKTGRRRRGSSDGLCSGMRLASPKTGQSTSRSKSQNRRYKKELNGATHQTAKAKKQSSAKTGKLVSLFQSCYGTTEQDFGAVYKRNRSYLKSVNVSQDFFDIGNLAQHSEEKTEERKALASFWGTKRQENMTKRRGSTGTFSKKWEEELIPIMTLLPPKKTLKAKMLDRCTGSMDFNDYDILSVHGDEVKRFADPEAPKDPLEENQRPLQKSLDDSAEGCVTHAAPQGRAQRRGSTGAMARKWEEQLIPSTRPSPNNVITPRKKVSLLVLRRGSTGAMIEQWEKKVKGNVSSPPWAV